MGQSLGVGWKVSLIERRGRKQGLRGGVAQLAQPAGIYAPLHRGGTGQMSQEKDGAPLEMGGPLSGRF